jgi:hypothetical protein
MRDRGPEGAVLQYRGHCCTTARYCSVTDAMNTATKHNILSAAAYSSVHFACLNSCPCDGAGTWNVSGASMTEATWGHKMHAVAPVPMLLSLYFMLFQPCLKTALLGPPGGPGRAVNRGNRELLLILTLPKKGACEHSMFCTNKLLGTVRLLQL